ncbi:CAP domain-containing protein [Truncatella angustata]|uniref:CAP domain-containing protein n=1 Tax=Truncatella angustata TaxID=152316 RepID=A0A9P8RHM0_9PEZI|nr:CAP domain-containing protein [Truncatella angustata]KAH6638523.1 CAP domain-containing protein [Truncatella angustata]
MPLFVLGQMLYANGQVTNEPPEGFVEKRATQPATLTLDQAVAVKVQNNQRLTKNLKSLIWDDALAANAQQWANYLASINNLMHSTSDQRPNQGENLAYSYNSNGVTYPLTQGAQGWVAEVSNYHNEIIPQGNFASYGHYTQVMWSSTNRIGMANATAANGGVYIVARYSPPGNYVGYRPY